MSNKCPECGTKYVKGGIVKYCPNCMVFCKSCSVLYFAHCSECPGCGTRPEKPPVKWPQEVTLYAHLDDMTLIEKGEKMGMPEEGIGLFSHFNEIELKCLVDAAGEVLITHVDGRRLDTDPEPQTNSGGECQ